MAGQQTWQWPSRIALVSDRADNNLYFAAKRGVDVILAGLLLILLSPLILVIAILISLDSAGPIFFTQERVGARRQSMGRQAIWMIRNFTMYKFRSMVQNADSSVHEAYIKDFVEGRAQATPENGGKFKLTNDPRVTPLGRLLRKFSLDELPQLINVLKGDIRGRVTFEEMIRMDIQYVENASLWLDLKVLFLTIPAVLSRRGAE